MRWVKKFFKKFLKPKSGFYHSHKNYQKNIRQIIPTTISRNTKFPTFGLFQKIRVYTLFLSLAPITYRLLEKPNYLPSCTFCCQICCLACPICCSILFLLCPADLPTARQP